MGEIKSQLSELAAARAEEFRTAWFEAIIAEYPPETSQFLKSNKDQFANPVGHALRTMVDDIISGLANGTPAADLGKALEPVIRIRSLQEAQPSKALMFVLSLKRMLLKAAAGDRGLEADAEAFSEAMLLHAFDSYMDCKRVLFEVRHDENRRNMFMLLQKAGMVAASEPTEGQNQGQN